MAEDSNSVIKDLIGELAAMRFAAEILVTDTEYLITPTDVATKENKAAWIAKHKPSNKGDEVYIKRILNGAEEVIFGIDNFMNLSTKSIIPMASRMLQTANLSITACSSGNVKLLVYITSGPIRVVLWENDEELKFLRRYCEHTKILRTPPRKWYQFWRK